MSTPSITFERSGPDSIRVRTPVRTWYFFTNDTPAAQVRFRVEGDELITLYRRNVSESWDVLDPEVAKKFRQFENAQEAAAYYLRQTHSTDWLFFVPVK